MVNASIWPGLGSVRLIIINIITVAPDTTGHDRSVRVAAWLADNSGGGGLF